eukprot:7837663-Pyramimonas_sp.AAC.1
MAFRRPSESTGSCKRNALCTRCFRSRALQTTTRACQNLNAREARVVLAFQISIEVMYATQQYFEGGGWMLMWVD